MLKVLQLIGAPGSGKTFLKPRHSEAQNKDNWEKLIFEFVVEELRDNLAEDFFYNSLIPLVEDALNISTQNLSDNNEIALKGLPIVLTIDECRVSDYAPILAQLTAEFAGPTDGVFGTIFVVFCIETTIT